MDEDDKQAAYEEFYDLVNMQPKEMEEWLATDEAKSVGQDSGDGKATGYKMGERIVELKRTNKGDLSDDDYAAMKKVNGYIKRHRAQEPKGDVKDSKWRYSLMNWGYDPLKEG